MQIVCDKTSYVNGAKKSKYYAALAESRERRVHPGYGVVNGVCECPDGVACNGPGKHSRLRGYQHLATTDKECIERWFERWPNSNPLGLIPKGEAELDIDLHNPDTANGPRTLATLEKKYGRLQKSVTLYTPSGGCRIRLRLPPGVIIPLKTQIGPGLELLGPGHNVVLAGAVGKKGIAYEYASKKNPADCEVALIPDWLLNLALTAKDNSPTRKPVSTSEHAPARDKKAKLTIPSRIPEGQRNDTLYKKACSERAYGADFDEIVRTLTLVKNERCESPETLPDKELRKITKSACQHPPGKNLAKVRAEVQKVFLLALAHPEHWKGRKGKSDLAVLFAFLLIALAAGSLLLTVSIRQAAEVAGVNKETAYKSILSLSQKGWLKLTKRFHNRRPNQYRLTATCDKSRTVQKTDTAPGGVELLSGFCRISEDAFRWQGLGKTPVLVLSVLNEKEKKASKIAELLGISKRTAERCLKRLAEYKLAVRAKTGWLIGHADLKDVAEKLGVAGTGERQRKQHKTEQDNYYRDLVRRKTHATEAREDRDTARSVWTVPIDMGEDAPSPVWEEEFREAASFRRRGGPDFHGAETLLAGVAG